MIEIEHDEATFSAGVEFRERNATIEIGIARHDRLSVAKQSVGLGADRSLHWRAAARTLNRHISLTRESGAVVTPALIGRPLCVADRLPPGIAIDHFGRRS